jgi:hypothetical protein
VEPGLHAHGVRGVERRLDGPARVRGSAGTGRPSSLSTRAVALVARFRAEAAERGEHPQPVLFTTFIRSLPPVFDGLYQRLPAARPDDQIAFRGVDASDTGLIGPGPRRSVNDCDGGDGVSRRAVAERALKGGGSEGEDAAVLTHHEVAARARRDHAGDGAVEAGGTHRAVEGR